MVLILLLYWLILIKECTDEINKIIIDNCPLLATHRHGCGIIQKLLDGPNKKIRNELIKKLVEQCFALIIDQFENYTKNFIIKRK